MKRVLTISRKHWHDMLAHVGQSAPLEACGLLAGRGSQVESVLAVRNQAQSPTRFVMDPYEQLHAFQWIESNGLELLGIFHSHPAGPATVSLTDIEEAAYEVAHVIWAPAENGWEARGFWIENGGLSEISLQIVD